MNESAILYETPHFWVAKSGGKYEINLHVVGASLKVGEKPNLEAAKRFVDKMEKYPQNIQYIVPPEYRFFVASIQK